MGDRMRTPNAPWLFTGMNGIARITFFFQLARVIVAVPRWDGIFVLGIFQQFAQRVAILGQTQNTAIDVFL